MAYVLIHLQGRTRGGTLGGRVLIGRWPVNTVVVDDPSVSRIHAWIGIEKGSYYIADTGSRIGTYVNGVLLQNRQVLHDGDEVMVGPLRLTYHADGLAPVDVEHIDLSPRSPAELSNDQGVFVDCSCGAPLWIPIDFTRSSRCRYCSKTVPAPTVVSPAPKPRTPPLLPPLPGISKEPAPPAAAPLARSPRQAPQEPDALEGIAEVANAPMDLLRHDAMPSVEPALLRQPPSSIVANASAPPRDLPHSASRELVRPPVRAPEKHQTCGVCHSGIQPGDAVHECPSCRLTFHEECWIENRGCSAFGCEQVGALERLSSSNA